MVFKNNSSFFLMLSTVRKLKRKCTIHYKWQNAAPVEPAADQPGKGKAADPVGRSAALSKSQTLAGKSQSRSGESRKVARHSRKP